ncbi:MAG: hypothetical protein HY017_25390 [Betaproteobacteria bacterium]|nr:hypothetical protein [Betaproteobacteria bacterium]
MAQGAKKSQASEPIRRGKAGNRLALIESDGVNGDDQCLRADRLRQERLKFIHAVRVFV